MKKISLEEYIKALEKMKRSPQDRLGILGELGATGIGVTAGVAISSSVAGVVGASTLAGSTTLASILGGVFVTTTPVGWVIGAAVAGGALAYAATKAIKSGNKTDLLKARTIRELKDRIQSLRDAASKGDVSIDQKFSELISSVQNLVVNNRLTQKKGTEVLEAVEAGQLSISEAFDLLQALI